MCGIVGIYLKTKKYEKHLGKFLSGMLDGMATRGPDSAGFAIYTKENKNIFKYSICLNDLKETNFKKKLSKFIKKTKLTSYADHVVLETSEKPTKIIDLLKKDKRWNNQFRFVEYSKKIKASYMVLPILIDRKFLYKKKKFINFLEKKGLETRPVISGSFVNQPSSELYNLNPGNQQFKGAQEIQDLSFVIGLHTKNITMSKLKFIIDLLFSIDTI